ncbi:hypothetical protein VC0395_A2343 [Vibrio cholerae O395]|uniref:Uncharacterized protein n=1 Tax=Vibrio cholerae serotype O1 (strain ATCC 39541 / Classical Ogawa 395 / O395) TaxID=345073 RepID=A0A0H3AH66_VIBC3|nr:hypothetical protein VC0395_A2343 [Vibrio cholerae O395]EMQ02011.1 hypothetical protein VC95412_000194 [Vibrio cholerae O1 str. 95412]
MFKNIKSIKNFGIFKGARTNAGQPFYQFNLFYGFIPKQLEVAGGRQMSESP